ncbi:unnamed protein product [Discosporangium mesarthrocarpum]
MRACFLGPLCVVISNLRTTSPLCSGQHVKSPACLAKTHTSVSEDQADRCDHDVDSSTLVVASTFDPASCVMVDALLKLGGWRETNPGGFGNGKAWLRSEAPSEVALWHVEVPLLELDDPDQRWIETVPRRSPSDVVFLSKHKAASGRPALCVHPIGLPDPSSSTQWGGRPGKCPPPSPRLAGCLREIRRACGEAGLNETFDVTLEVTHHGPWLQTPAMFVEIGSTEEHWGRRDAANAWANALSRMLGLDGSPGHKSWLSLPLSERLRRTVIVGIGGGHYAPKLGDIASRKGRYVGHMVPSYALDFAPGGRWRDAVSAVVESTRVAYPGAGAVVAHVDKKSFKSVERAAVLEHLAEIGVEAQLKASDC